MEKKDVELKKENPKGQMAFKVYIPEEKKHIINKYISYAKLYENNQVWQVMEKAFRKLEDEENLKNRFIEELPERLTSIEQRMAIVENALESNDSEKTTEDTEIKTFGGSKNGK